MNYRILDDFEIYFENENNANYLVFSTKTDKKYSNYQVEMLSNNSTNFLPLRVGRIDNNLSFYYDITSNLSLIKYLETHKLNNLELFKILKCIVKTLLDCEDLILSDESILFNFDYIYINENTLEVYFVYIPIEMENNSLLILRDLLIDLVTSKIKMMDVFDNDYINKIVDVLKSDKFSIVNLKKLLNELEFEGDNIQSIETGTKSENYFNDSNDILGIGDQDKIRSFMEFKVSETRVKEVKKENLKKENFKIDKNIFIAVSVQIFLLVIIAVLVLSKVLDNLSDDKMTNYTASFVIVILLSVLNWRVILSNSPKGADIKSSKEKNSNDIQNFDFAIPGQEYNTVSNIKNLKRVKSEKINKVKKPKTNRIISKKAFNILNIEPDKILKKESGKQKNHQIKEDNSNKMFNIHEKSKLKKKKNDLNNEKKIEKRFEEDIYSKSMKEIKQPEIKNNERLKDIDLDKTVYLENRNIKKESVRLNSKFKFVNKRGRKSYLIYVKNGKKAKVVIDKDKFVLGRMSDRVDYVISNDAVGKVHANIYKFCNRFYIKDLKSMNGTYINGEKLTENTIRRLKNNDVVKLANTKLKFKENKLMFK